MNGAPDRLLSCKSRATDRMSTPCSATSSTALSVPEACRSSSLTRATASDSPPSSTARSLVRTDSAGRRFANGKVSCMYGTAAKTGRGKLRPVTHTEDDAAPGWRRQELRLNPEYERTYYDLKDSVCQYRYETDSIQIQISVSLTPGHVFFVSSCWTARRGGIRREVTLAPRWYSPR